MDLTSKTIVKNLLKSYQIRPSKGLGQNFSIDRDAVRKIIEAANPQSDDIILEIGPGLGVLTQELAKRAKKVIAVEKDPKMVEILGETLKGFNNIEIIHGDIRKFYFPKTPGVDEGTPGVKTRKSNFQNFKVVGNLPFYLTAPVIRQFLELTETRSPQMTLVVQKEVGQRICSKPPDMNLLAVSVQFYAEPKIISYISKDCFWPQPDVNATIIKITPKVSTLPVRVDLFFKIVKAGFSQPRKQLINNLSKGLKIDRIKVTAWLSKNNIQPTQRAETLSVDDWVRLVKDFRINQ